MSNARRSSGFSWSHDPLDERLFVLLSWLLQYHDKQQEPTATSKKQPDPASDDSDSEIDSDAATCESHGQKYQGAQNQRRRRLLCRLSEVLARVKSNNKQSRRKYVKYNANSPSGDQEDVDSANHVAAAILVEDDEEAIVYVSKNVGLDEEDKLMMGTLEKWISVMARTGCRPKMDTDEVWWKLIDYSANRTNHYVEQILTAFNNIKDSINYDTSSIKPKLFQLYDHCSQVGPDEHPPKHHTRASKAISLAYEFRSDPNFLQFMQKLPSTSKRRTLQMSIYYLGRLRTAYETFKETAMHFASFKNLRIIPVEPPVPRNVQINLNFTTKTLNGLGRLTNDFGVKAQELTRHCRQKRHTHAEIQLLLQIHNQDAITESMSIFPYIGTSKKTCFLCAQILRYIGKVETRGSHSKVYPLWAIPTLIPLEPRFALRLEAAVLFTQRTMMDLIKDRKKALKPVAESSVGLSTQSSGMSAHQRLQHRAKVERRHENANHDVSAKQEPPRYLFGAVVGEIQAIRIPVEGHTPEIIPLSLCEVPNPYKCCDSFMKIVPQFEKYWGLSQFDRAMQSIEVREQDPPSLEGFYRLYWNTDADLPENQYLKGLLLSSRETVSLERRFFCGDVFIIGFLDDAKYGEDEYYDVSSDFLRTPLIKSILTTFWEDDLLGKEVEETARMDEFTEDHERVRALTFATMTKEEQMLVDQNPSLLDYIIIMEGKHADGKIPTGISYPDDKPGMVALHFIRKVTAVDELGWQGFSSKDL